MTRQRNLKLCLQKKLPPSSRKMETIHCAVLIQKKKRTTLENFTYLFYSLKKAGQKFELKFDTTVSNKTCTSLFNKTQVTVIASKQVNVGIDGSYEVFINKQKLVQES